MIEIKHLTKRYGPLTAVNDVSFSVARGDILGFLGPNGAGKTTTLKILTGFLTPDEGSVRVDGLDPSREPIAVRRKLGYLPEHVPLYTEMFVDEYLDFVARVKGVEDRRRAVGEVVAACQLEKVERRQIAKLSKGYRQRVGLAQALIGQPEVLILDEPTIGLDPAQIVEIRNLIRSLAGEKTIILSTHILPEVNQICSRVVIIAGGKVIAEDTPRGLTSPGEAGLEIVLKVTGSGERMENVFSRVDGLAEWKAIQREGETASFKIVGRPGCDVRPQLAREVVAAGLDLLEMKAVRLSLEDVFVKLVTREEGRYV